MPQWTDEQLRAIEARGRSILLSAAAGSGKTTVLVERVLRLVTEDGADVDRMLVVTFTRAAASEMRARLSRRLSERAAAGDARCREQLMRLDRAAITTLHAFCADFLRTNFEAAGVDPAFRILDDAASERLKQEALSEALELAYAGDPDAEDVPSADALPDPDVLSLDYGRGPAGVRSAVEALLRHMEARPDPAAWLERAARFDEDALRRWQDELKDGARRAIGAAMVQLRLALQVPDCPIHYENAMRADLEALRALDALEDYDALYRGLTDFRPTPARSGRRGGGDPEAADAVKRLRDAAKRALQEARLLKLPLLTAREDARRLAGQVATLSRIAMKAWDIYDAKKAEQAGLTYADLEHRTLAAVSNPGAAALMRARFDYIFVDEYQDTSDLQEAIIRAIRREDNLFMVGDVKQSIYRFRMAEPRLFLEKYAAYGAGDGGLLLPLTRNFRSRRGILDFVNQVFEKAMTGGDSEIEYDELARLNPGDPDAPASAEPGVAIHIIESGSHGEDAPQEADEAIADLKGAEREAVLIARIIREMMAADPTLHYRDFAILTRARSAPFSAMMPILLSAGIPTYADGAAGYYESLEIGWTLSMLRLIANRRLDVDLIGILRSPAVGLSVDDLARIRAADRVSPFCDAAAAYAESGNDPAAEALRTFFERYRGWRLRCGSMALGEFVRLMLDESGFYTYVGALPGGAQRQANLDQFVAAAGSFDREVSGALTRFLQYVEYLRSRGEGDAAHLLSESDDVVRMMTIHKSKGLEFRVVIGAQLAKKYRVETSSAPIVAHRDLGVGMPYLDPDLRTRRMTLPQAAIIERQKREDAAEELRILYVLLTRARERLVLVGSVRDAEAARRRWQALSEVPFAAVSHLDVVMAALSESSDAVRVAFHPASTIQMTLREAGQAAAAEVLTRVTADPAACANPKLDAELSWEYPDPNGAKRPLKLTASGLVRELEGPEALPTLTERPQFLAEDARRMTGAERGTAYHRAMQLLDWRGFDGLSGDALAQAVSDQLDAFVARHLMSPAQREVVRPERLARFLESPMGRRLLHAEAVRREWPFNVRLKAAEALGPEEAGRFGDADLLVQGTIDCCFIEDGRWVLLDYKTDRADDLDALRAHYRSQLHLYALALERITGRPVAQKALCLIARNAVIDV